MFHLGNLILIEPLQKTDDPRKFRYQFFIVDEMKKNQVVIGAALDYDVLDPQELEPFSL